MIQVRIKTRVQGSQAVSITTVILLKQVASGHDHLWIVCCWYSVMAGSVRVSEYASACVCVHNTFVNTLRMGVLCVKTKFKRLAFHSPELVKTLCAGV